MQIATPEYNGRCWTIMAFGAIQYVIGTATCYGDCAAAKYILLAKTPGSLSYYSLATSTMDRAKNGRNWVKVSLNFGHD